MVKDSKELKKLICTQCTTHSGKVWCTCFTLVDPTKEFKTDDNCMNPEHRNKPFWRNLSNGDV
jgi:hypothetical protein